MKNFDDFWLYLQDKASDNDAWWLDQWLEDCKNGYEHKKECPKCKSKRRTVKSVWSKTGNHILAEITKCTSCDYILEIKDMKASIRKSIDAGNVLQKDIDTLKHELEAV